jgi:Holliday junction resolvase
MSKRGKSKIRGYRVERKVRQIFESNGWKVIRAGASLGEADLVCLKRGKCILIQVKSTKKKIFYYYEYMKERLEKFPFLLVVDFGYGNIRVLPPRKKVTTTDGESIEDFLRKFKA